MEPIDVLWYGPKRSTTEGFCKGCRKLIPVGAIFWKRVTGPDAKDWDRWHNACRPRPPIDAPRPSTMPPPQRETELSLRHVVVLSGKGNYGVLDETVGKILYLTRNRVKASAVCEFLNGMTGMKESELNGT